MSEKALQPVEQREVLFYGDEIVAVRVADGSVYIPVRPICELLGLNWSGQRQRIERDPVLSVEAMSVFVTHSDIDPHSRRPRTSEMLCIPLDYLSGFLFGINAARVKDEIRERLIRYQRECYKVLAEAFQEGRLTADPTLDELLQQDTPEAQAYRLAQAVLKMARTQLLMRAQLEDHERRLEYLEDRLDDPGRHVTPDQAMQISQAVKTVALAIGKKSGRNEFGAVYGDMYRRFGITSYKMLPAGKFEEALAWLTDWYQSVTGATGDQVPF